MFSIIGILVVFGAVLGGFLLEKGQVAVLIQPSEFLIIGGAALGTLLSANPVHVLKKIASGLVQVLGGSKFSKKRYVESLKMMFSTLREKRAKKGWQGSKQILKIQRRVLSFRSIPSFLKSHHIRDFVCDTMRMAITGGAGAHRPRPNDGTGYGCSSCRCNFACFCVVNGSGFITGSRHRCGCSWCCAHDERAWRPS